MCEENAMGGMECPAGNCCREGICQRDTYSKVCYLNSNAMESGANFQHSGGVDGTRTRDPRRDRPVDDLSIGAGFSLFSYSKDGRFPEEFPSDAKIAFQRISGRRPALKESI